MFKTIKTKVNILEGLGKILDTGFRQVGENTYALEDNSCPFCGHMDCFRVKDIGEESIAKCFSCDINGQGGGDLVHIVSNLKELPPKKAGELICEMFGISTPKASPIHSIFDAAAEYYHTYLIDSSTPASEVLGGITPLQFQLTRRGHSQETIDALKVGWSNGGLVRYLTSIGFSEEIVEESGLSNKSGNDFFPANTFIYPHYVNSQVSHFTFKDPTKRLDYQLANKCKLNKHMFYGQDSIKGANEVIVVEGENDLASVLDSKWSGGVVASIGQLSGNQVQWCIDNLKDKNVTTIFDSDDAGDKYRAKFEKARNQFKNLKQIRLDGVKDIDEYIQAGNSLESCMNSEIVPEAGAEVSVETEKSSGNIIEDNGCYYRVKYKDGEAKLQQISDFTIQVKWLLKHGKNYVRQVVIKTQSGKVSKPIEIDSETKVSIRLFKVAVANAIDANFYGKEEDLDHIWKLAYHNVGDKEVQVYDTVGHMEDVDGWMFRDIFINPNGSITEVDKEGIAWVAGSSEGMKSESLDSAHLSPRKFRKDIPTLDTSLDSEQREELLEGVIRNLGKNFGCMGKALTAMGWLMSNAYSDDIFEAHGYFPFLYIWGTYGKGKTKVVKWLLSAFGMEENGYITIPNLKSGVGFTRKVAYYGSLPVAVDEIRDNQETASYYGTFRSWVNRAGRSMGARDSFGIRTQNVVSNFIFSGQDVFADGATRERCVTINIDEFEREMKDSYKWIEARKKHLSAIGFHWILEAQKRDIADILDKIEDLDIALREQGCSSRMAKGWAIVGYFADLLADKYVPEFDYKAYLLETVKFFSEEQKSDDIIAVFFNTIERLQVGDHPKITEDHVLKRGNKIYMWNDAVYQIVKKEIDINFSLKALLSAINNEEYCEEVSARENMGLTKPIRRRVSVFNYDLCPVNLKNIGDKCEVN